MKFTIAHTWAQEEYREIEIEAKTEQEAIDQLKAMRQSGELWDYKEALGEVVTDSMEIINHANGTISEPIEL